MQNFISPNRNSKDISKEANKKIYGRSQKTLAGALQKAQTFAKSTTHPFNPNYKGGKSQFVDPKGASSTVLKKYNR